ncbi:MAG: M3 family oligoendopeptidase [bacterium]|nr:M3 family oligoendopeptidase [bacterium]
MKFKDMPYQRLEYDKVKQEFDKILAEFKAAKSGEQQFEVHKKKYQLFDDIMTTITLCEIRNSIDTTDPFYEDEKAYCDEIQPLIENMQHDYEKALEESKFRDYLEEKIGKVAFKNIEIGQKAFDEKLIPLMQEENTLVTEYNKLIASAKIEWDGETLNLSLLRKYLTNADREIRRKAYQKYSAFFEKNGAALDEIYDKLVKNRTSQAKLMGYDNFVELGYYRVNRNCYDANMVNTFRSQIKEYFVPLAEKVHERRRARLGVDQLSFIDRDVYFKNGNPEPTGTPEQIMEAGTTMYHELSEETKEFIDFMTENELFDVLGRKTKQAGGYMTFLPKYDAPFIFANFNGTCDDVNVITHECGHAFQGYLTAKDPIKEHLDLTMETAEIHSMSMEFFARPWLHLFFGERTEEFLEMQLEDAIVFIPYGCMVDEYQHIVYEHPELSPKERNAAWRKLEKTYMPHLRYEESPYLETGTYWQKQQHIYNDPFYYIDYCIAQICAFQYKVKMDEDYKKAWESYLSLCRASASDFFVNLIKDAGLENPFEDGCIKKLVEKLEGQLNK